MFGNAIKVGIWSSSLQNVVIVNTQTEEEEFQFTYCTTRITEWSLTEQGNEETKAEVLNTEEAEREVLLERSSEVTEQEVHAKDRRRNRERRDGKILRRNGV